ncbi:L-aspartate oxidase [Xanthobacter agilis]|uniref:L-aspartate oxidase n=1 Tax=Xanthobacter agilis TaxID=47492 RepID=A0ABU0LF25_XANAG|nr:L-aspartate oxidase [Xanthobacter agilis]MDQ0505749.1 L-aspartate oxidase [Xanthobacter agilis]
MTAALAGCDARPVIVGGGVAGLAAALFLAPRPVVLITRAPLGADGSSPLAQGGMAASVGDDDDADLHLADTLAAGDGLCDPIMARRILTAAPDAITELARIGTRFDRDAAGRLALGLEAAHSRRRIVHADGDATGRELVRALAAAVRACPSVTVVEGVEARRLVMAQGAVAGLLVAGDGGGTVLRTAQVALATGGVGALFAHTTNPDSAFGLGLALAARAGAALMDLEFVQFHPTALAGTARPLSLVSEAVRGEGATLITADGTRFLAQVPGAELAPRDVVARAVWAELSAGRTVFLDARSALGQGFARRFPAIAGLCASAGIDPATQPIPIRPAAHYHMGGIAVDGEGRSTVAGLWACGEVASTGLHGANRLASNSLVEGVVCGRWVAESIAGTRATPPARRLPAEMPPPPDPAAARAIVSRHLGVLRDGDGLKAAITALAPLARSGGADADPALVGLMMAVSALGRQESRGAHTRTDCPQTAHHARRSRLTLDDAWSLAEGFAAPPAARVRSQ